MADERFDAGRMAGPGVAGEGDAGRAAGVDGGVLLQIEAEVRLYWFAAKCLRLTPPEAGLTPEVDEALDDLLAIAANTDSEKLARACDDLLDEEARRCGF